MFFEGIIHGIPITKTCPPSKKKNIGSIVEAIFTEEQNYLYFVDFSNLLHKIVVYIGSIRSRDSNHLPHDSHYDVLTTMLKTGGKLTKGRNDI